MRATAQKSGMQYRLALPFVALAFAGCSGAHPPTESRFELATPPAHVRAPAPLPSAVIVYVAGNVVHPGVYRLPAGTRIVDALHRAGDAKPKADLIAVNLAEPLRDGEEIAVPAKGEHRAAPRRRSARQNGPARATSGKRRSRKSAPATPIDLNTADANALAALPGVGIGLAERIVQFRETNGPFDSVDELADVAGITDRRLESLAPYLTVNGR
jgi:competence protein ComEA